MLAALALLAAAAVPAFASAPPATSLNAAAPAGPVYIPDLRQWLPQANSREALTSSMQILVMITLLTVLPSIVLLMTCFVRMVVVLALLRQALGTQALPPSQVVVGLAFFLTLLVMMPTWHELKAGALDPYLEGRTDQLTAIDSAGGVLREFMFDQIEAARNEQDVYMLYEYAERRALRPDETLTRAQVPMVALIPAFVLSELKAAFVLGFRLYLPFLVIDMVIATVLVAMGMMMLPPVLISFPFKLLLFVLADGWHLVAGSLMASVM
jgi:flagellar biosynthetic protein FliP